MPYVCPSCKKTKKLPDYCCGGSMIAAGSYYCNKCGTSSSGSGMCCEQEMQQI